MQIIFVFVCLSFTQGNHHDFIFAKEESVKKKKTGYSCFQTVVLLTTGTLTSMYKKLRNTPLN